MDNEQITLICLANLLKSLNQTRPCFLCSCSKNRASKCSQTCSTIQSDHGRSGLILLTFHLNALPPYLALEGMEAFQNAVPAQVPDPPVLQRAPGAEVGT